MKKETVEDLYRNLQQSFDHWHILYTQGGSDPFWADGVNLNLVRNHILYYRKRIDELSPDETRRDLYHRELPPIVESEYMANPEEIRQKAKASLQKLEQEMGRSEAELKMLALEMNNCGSNYGKLAELTARQQEVQSKLEEMEERWLYLSEFAE